MPPGSSTLYRGLVRPPAALVRYSSHLAASTTTSTSSSSSSSSSQLNFYLVNRRRRGNPRPRKAGLSAALPVANLETVRKEIENAHNHDAVYQGRSTSKYVNLLARLTLWKPLSVRLQNSSDSFATFRYEADVCNRLPVKKSQRTPRLVDQADYVQDMNLWLEILRFRLRLDGHQCVLDVVEAMIARRVVLPLHGPQADQIWSLLLWSAVQNPPVLRCLYPYIRDTLPRSGLADIRLYHRIVGPLLRQNPMFAVSWHKRLQADGISPTDLSPVFVQFCEDVCLSLRKARAIEAFKKIYVAANIKHVYDECMPYFCRTSDFTTAVDLHAFFVRHDDLPSLSTQSAALVAHLTEHAWLAKSNMKLSARKNFAAKALDVQHEFEALKHIEHNLPSAETVTSLTRETMNTIVGDVHDIREKEVNDAFCARLFATTAFSTDLIITGLRMLGLKIVGNLALREIAARAPVPVDYIATVDAIKAAGISVVDSVFSRALQSFATSPDKHQSFHFVVNSDQHPSTYEDRGMQKRLFTSFLISGRHSQANAVLDILTLDMPKPENYHANLILQAYARRGQRDSILQVLHEMRLHRIPVSAASLRYIVLGNLRPRARSKRPITQQNYKFHNDLNFTTNVLLESLRTGQLIDPAILREILKRYGMNHNMESVERLCITLAMWYSGRLGDVARPLPTTTTRQGIIPSSTSTVDEGMKNPLRVIFTPHMLRAIIAWGFKSDVSNNSLGWTRGLALVRKLKSLGVDISGQPLRREARLRLWTIYGPGRSSVLRNRQAQMTNTMTLTERVWHIHQIMGANWLKLHKRVLGRTDVTHWTMYRVVFRQPRRVRKRTKRDRG